MKVFVATEYRVVSHDGRYYVYEKLYNILGRYYNAFGSIVLCTRIVEEEPNARHKEITGFLDKTIKVNLGNTLFFLGLDAMIEEIKTCDLVIGRFDSIVSCRAAYYAKKYNKPFFAEIMADAWDGYWNHGFLGKILAPYMYYATKKAIGRADYALYVTREFLQNRYPCDGKTINASNVLLKGLDGQALEKRFAKIQQMDNNNLVLGTTAAVDVHAKGQEYVVRALRKLREKGVFVTYCLIGGGNQEPLISLAKKEGVSEQLVFKGELSYDEVLAEIEKIDIYIQPSLQEGLPRSVIEAMSKGCPCLGSRTAGIPELISPNCVFKRKSVDDIVNTIIRINNKETLKQLAEENFKASGDYLDSVLSARRANFYNNIKIEICHDKSIANN